MRMWMVPPELLCRKHLMGEHVETHMFVGTLKAGKSIGGYLKKGLVEPQHLKARHDALAAEMTRRGYNHQSPIDNVHSVEVGEVDVAESLRDLSERCPECRKRMSA